MRPRASALARFFGVAVTFAVLVWRLGFGPFLDGIRTVDGRALLAAAALAVPTTVCCAWRWKIVAERLGVELSLPAAVAAYYRSLFLNVTLPGGIVGDVHRGVSHGRDASNVGGSLRAVAWERFAGQVVQAVLTVAALLALPSPVHSYMPLVAVALVVVVFCSVLALRAQQSGERSAFARLLNAVSHDIRSGLLDRRAWPRIVVLSALIVCGHALTFLIAARTAGITAPASRVLPLGLLVMLVMVVPSVGGWGPREGTAAWAFAAAGMGAEQGVVTAVAYGVMVFVASLPGAAVLAVSSLHQARLTERVDPALTEEAAHA